MCRGGDKLGPGIQVLVALSKISDLSMILADPSLAPDVINGFPPKRARPPARWSDVGEGNGSHCSEAKKSHVV